MTSLVLDCSVTISWFMPNEYSTLSWDILNQVANKGAIVPTLWQLEVGNVLLIAERKNRITKEQRLKAISALNDLPITINQNTHIWLQVMELAELYKLTSYDASYLELCIRYNLPLATFDKELQTAAKIAGIILITN